MVATSVAVGQFCKCRIFQWASATPVTCPYRAEQATGLAGGYDFLTFCSGVLEKGAEKLFERSFPHERILLKIRSVFTCSRG